MCNQTEMYKEIDEYDRRASQGLEHIRGIAHHPASCPKCLKEKRSGKTTYGILESFGKRDNSL